MKLPHQHRCLLKTILNKNGKSFYPNQNLTNNLLTNNSKLHRPHQVKEVKFKVNRMLLLEFTKQER